MKILSKHHPKMWPALKFFTRERFTSATLQIKILRKIEQWGQFEWVGWGVGAVQGWASFSYLPWLTYSDHHLQVQPLLKPLDRFDVTCAETASQCFFTARRSFSESFVTYFDFYMFLDLQSTGKYCPDKKLWFFLCNIVMAQKQLQSVIICQWHLCINK